MKNKNNQEAYFERMRELAAVNKQVIKESKSTSTLLEYKKAGDGRLYGIVKENQSYFIKTAQSKKSVSDADFAYIGGLGNITEYKCNSLTEAQRVLNTKVMTVNETYGSPMMEDDQEQQKQQPQAQPAPQPQAEPQPEPMPEPMPEPQPEAQPEPEEAKDEIHSAISKAAGMFSGAQIEAPKVEYYLKQFLGVIKDSQLSKLRDEQKEVIFDEYFGDVQSEEQPDEMGEGFDYLSESDIFEDAELADDDMMDDEDELEIVDSPEMGSEVDIAGMDSVNGGGKEVQIDLNAGTVNVKLSESKIKQLAKKYNVSESYIKWKMGDIMNEEVDKIEKEKLKEQKVRKVVRNIIKEKLGLKKKTLKESVSKERLKLEKLVESVLKKNM
jgi:hypothetical protein